MSLCYFVVEKRERLVCKYVVWSACFVIREVGVKVRAEVVYVSCVAKIIEHFSF